MKLTIRPKAWMVALAACTAMSAAPNVGAQTYCSSAAPVAIPDNTPTTASMALTVPDTFPVTALIVTVSFTHTFDGDIGNMVLIAPSGQIIALSLAGGVGSSGDNYKNTTFDNSATTVIGTAQTGNTQTNTAPFRTRVKATATAGTGQITLAAAQTAGLTSNGTWALRCNDLASGDVGTIDYFLLSFNEQVRVGGDGLGTDQTATPSPSQTGLTLAIPDNSTTGVTSTTVVAASDSAIITGVDLSFSVTHPTLSDLRVRLIHPNGTTFVDVAVPGTLTGSATTPTTDGGSPTTPNHPYATLVSASAPLFSTGAAPYRGKFAPANPLTPFNGLASGGTWTLQVNDEVATNTGTLREWTLHLRTASAACCAPDGTCTVTQVSACAATSAFLGTQATCNASAPFCPGATFACCSNTTLACTFQASACGTGFTQVGSTCSPTPCSAACCANNNTCTIVSTSAACASPSILQAQGTTCSGAGGTCPAATNACCNNTTLACVFQTAACGTGTTAVGSVCSPTPCSAACCANNNTCTIVSTSAGCASPSILRAQGTTCSGAGGTCPATINACCNNTTLACVFQVAACGTGTTAVGSVCSPTPCSAACCANDRSCTIVSTSAACASPNLLQAQGTTCSGAGGTCPAATNACCNNTTLACVFQIAACGTGTTAIGSVCSPTPCSGACCNTTGVCAVVSTSAACASPNLLQAQGTTCSGAGGTCPAATNACCNNTTLACVFQIAACGTGTTAIGSVCSPTPCSGACCNTTGVCAVVSTSAACASPNLLQAQGTTCSGAGSTCPVATNACCNNTTLACVFQIAACGTGTTAIGSVCSPTPCSGACCNATGVCAVVTASAACASPNLLQAQGTTCSGAGGTCPNPTGACCNQATGACIYINGASCPGGSTISGTTAVVFSGPGTVCSPNTCVPLVRFSQFFDTTPVGTLPSGWTSAVTGTGGNNWAVVSDQSHTSPRAVFTNDSAMTAQQSLTLPPVTAAGNLILDLWSMYGTESCCDAWTIQASKNGGAFANIGTAASFALNGYTVASMTSIGGQPGFSGTTTAFSENIAIYPAVSGDAVVFRFLMGSDSSLGVTGVWLDDIIAANIQLGACCAADGTCAVVSGAVNCASPSLLQAVGSTCSGPGGTCPVATKACCDPVVGGCVFTNLVTCAPGTIAAGTVCSPTPCTGACCDVSGVCTTTVSASCPATSAYFGDGTACTPTACLVKVTLVANQCYKVGDAVTVLVNKGLSAVSISGGQFFLSYDTTKLTYTGGDPGDGSNPYNFELLDVGGAGTVDYAVGVTPGGPATGVRPPATMARLHFTATAPICAGSSLVMFRPHNPSSRLSDSAAVEVPSSTMDLGALTIDSTIPVATAPSNRVVPADAGLCTAVVNPGTPTGTDNCTAPADLIFTGVRSDALALTAPYPGGVTTIHWTATDCSGNVSLPSDQTITVLATSNLNATVQLANVNAAPFNRCITFNLYNTASCPNPAFSVQSVITFTGGVGSAVISVPCGAYTGATATDSLHTLRRTADGTPFNHFGVVGTNYVATFIDSSTLHGPADAGNDALLGGNFNNDQFVDILDFGTLLGQFNVNYGSGNTTCSTVYPHADLNGDGTVHIDDYTFISANFLRAREADPCGAALTGSPVSDISVFDLALTDWEAARKADVNHDGRVNFDDIAYLGAHGMPRCPADFNSDQAVSVQDIFSFIGAWFSGYPAADFNDDHRVGVQDIFDFLNSWFVGCP